MSDPFLTPKLREHGLWGVNARRLGAATPKQHTCDRPWDSRDGWMDAASKMARFSGARWGRNEAYCIPSPEWR